MTNDASTIEAAVQVREPLLGWCAGKRARFHARKGLVSPAFFVACISKGDDWSALDDLLRGPGSVALADGLGRRYVPADRLAAAVGRLQELGELGRLRVWRLPAVE